MWKSTELPPDVRDFREEQAIIENVRRAVLALEVCSCCQCVSECEPSPFVNQRGIWYCRNCLHRLTSQPSQP